MADVMVSEKMQLSVGMEFTFMGAQLNASYTKTNTGYQIFVAPTAIENNVGITIKEMVDQFNSMSGAGLTEDAVIQKINMENQVSAESFDFDSVRFVLKMVFLNIKVEDDKPNEKKVEYALSIKVDASELIPSNIKVINIDSLSFNIWNTQREGVLDKMALISPEDF